MLAQGADPNTRLGLDEPPISWWSWLHQHLRGKPITPSVGYPCLLWELGIEAEIPPTRYRPKPPPEDPILVNALLEHGANVNGEGYAKMTPLLLAAQNNYARVALLLLRHHARIEAVDEEEQTALMLAVQRSKSSLALLDVLLQHGANINAQDELGSTALMMAVEHRNQETVRWLLAHHADVHLVRQDGWTALLYAGDTGDRRADKDIIALLRHTEAKESH